MGVKMSVIKEQMVVLESEKLKLKNQLDLTIEKSGKKQGESSSLQVELEENLKTTKTKLALALERNNHLDRGLVQLKEELTSSLKWKKSSELLSNLNSQSNYNKKGLGSLNITPPYNPHSKYLYVSDNLMHIHCGRNGNLKGECKAWKESSERFSIYTRQKRVPRMGPCPVPKSLIKNT